ncbi:WD40-repeat-containing domain protein [Suillus paluster]|uniref:WD40-repeat-containing domain protein n=1 Tax=Suillus paluster TaxID=48578 RepID=UPI001B85F687|nr:WD40-repeat-containing domain protein [Suillus paluster]KAG1750616.1 WD40-repeat-containing domain protein [Suillus paluster]
MSLEQDAHNPFTLSQPRPCSTPPTSSKMSHPIPSTKRFRVFRGHEKSIRAVAVFPDRRMVTCSYDKTLRFWDLKTGRALKKMEGRAEVDTLAVSRDGKVIASGDEKGHLIARHGRTGGSLTHTIIAHFEKILSLDFSPDGTVLATGSADSNETTKLWNTKTWQEDLDNPIECSDIVFCVRYSPSGKYLAIATSKNIEIHNAETRERVAIIEDLNWSLAWTPDGTRLLSGGSSFDPTIREWDVSTWEQVGDAWVGHTDLIYAIAIHPAGTLVASASYDRHVRLWGLSDRRTIAIFQHSAPLFCVTFSIDGKHILSGGDDKMISEWEVPKDVLPKEAPEILAPKTRDSDSKILIITTTVRKACIAGDLSAAEKILTQEIQADANNNTSYANRSLVMARQLEWDRALQDAIKSLSVEPSLAGYLAKGIALCGKRQVSDATNVFNVAFAFADGDSKTNHFLFLIKAIALFNVNHKEEEMLPIQELATHPNPDPLAARVVEAYLRVQLGIIAMEDNLHKQAAEHFTAAVKAGVFFYKSDIHSMYDDFVVLFGWDLKSLWQIANKKRCHALVRAGQIGAAFEAYRYMMDMSDEATKAIFVAWTNTLNGA